MVISDRASEKALNYAAPIILGSPWWLPSLHDVSIFAAELVPILTLAWVVIQIGIKAYDRYKLYKSKKKED